MSVYTSFPPSNVTLDTARTTANIFEQVLQYRTLMAEWVGTNAKSMSNLINNFDGLLNSNFYRNTAVPGQTGDESTTIANIVDMANDLKLKTLPLIEDFADAASALLAAPPSVPNLQALVDAVVASILSELDDTEPESIAVFKALIKSIVDTALLNTTYDITAGELTEIATLKAAFISERESKLEEKMFLIERQSVASLVAKTKINSTKGTEILARGAAHKARLFLEIADQASEYERQLRNEAFQRIYEKMKIKIQSGTIIPQELIKLPNAAYGIFDGILNRLFLSPGQFVNQLPQILVAAIQSLGDVTRLLQDDRYKRLAGDQQSDQNITQLFSTVLSGYSSLIQSTGKLATFEGS